MSLLHVQQLVLSEVPARSQADLCFCSIPLIQLNLIAFVFLVFFIPFLGISGDSAKFQIDSTSKNVLRSHLRETLCDRFISSSRFIIFVALFAQLGNFG
jgi:hypothetical protein